MRTFTNIRLLRTLLPFLRSKSVQNLSNRQFQTFHWFDRNKMEKEFHLESKELLTKCVTPFFCKWISIYRNSFLLKRRVCKNWGRKQEEKCHSLDKLYII